MIFVSGRWRGWRRARRSRGSGGIADQPSCVSKWSGRLRATGSVSAGQIGGHKPRVLSGAHADWLRARVSSASFTLRGLAAELAERGVKVDYRSVWEFAIARG